MKVLLISSYFFVYLNLSAQYTFDRTYPTNSDTIEQPKVIVEMLNNYVVIGSQSVNNFDPFDDSTNWRYVTFFEFDEAGNKLDFNRLNFGKNHTLVDAVLLNNTNYGLITFSQNGDSAIRPFLVIVDQNYNVIHYKQLYLESRFNEHDKIFNSKIIKVDDEVIIGISDLDMVTMEMDVDLIKMDAQANELWRKRIGLSNLVDKCENIAVDENGIWVHIKSFTFFQANSYWHSTLYRLDLDGNIVYSIDKGDETSPWLISNLYVNSKNNLIITENPNHLNPQFNYTKITEYVTDTVEVMSYTSESNNISMQTSYNSLFELKKNGQYLLIGSSIIEVNGVYDFKISLSFLDEYQNLVWKEDFINNSFNGVSNVIKCNDGGFAILSDFINLGNLSNIHLIKTDCEGKMEWQNSCDKIETTLPILVYPNPTSNTVTFQIDPSFREKKIQIQIHSTLGQQVINYYSTEFVNHIDISMLSKAVYFYTIFSDETKIHNGKIIIE